MAVSHLLESKGACSGAVATAPVMTTVRTGYCGFVVLLRDTLISLPTSLCL